MKRIYQFLIFIVFMLSNVCFAVNSLDYTITYKNDSGSTLTLTWHPDKDNTGTIDGIFNSGVGSCQQARGMPAAVTGVFTGNALAMTISYPKCDRVVAMTGNVKNGKQNLQLLWLVTSRSNSRDNLDSHQVGSDTYIQIAS